VLHDYEGRAISTGDAWQCPAGNLEVVRRADAFEQVVGYVPWGVVLVGDGRQTFQFYDGQVMAAIALLLVVVGVFSVTADNVSLRTQEFGIRSALGAQQSDILAMVVRRGMSLIGAGGLLGVVLSLGVARLLSSQLWGVSPHDPAIFALVVAMLAAAGLAACLIPARRAARVDPMVALRYE
jgi:ABC-type antimicrobial peptide transport system permease subunit